MPRPVRNMLQFVHALPRFYAGRNLFVDSTYGSNTNAGTDPQYPLRSITFALTLCTDDMDDVIVVLSGYNNTNTNTETNGDDTPIVVDKNTVTILALSRNIKVQAIESGDSIFQIDANHVTIGALPHSCWQVAAAEAGTTSTVVEIQSAAVYAEVFGFKNVAGADMDNYDELITIAATAHGAFVHHNMFVGNTTDTDEGIMIEGTVDGIRIEDNVLMECCAANGGIYSASIHTNCKISRNIMLTVVGSKMGINFTANATGVQDHNLAYVDADNKAFINGYVTEFENYANDAFSTQGFLSAIAAT